MKYFKPLIFFVTLLFVISCNDDNNNESSNSKTVKVRFIEEICCGDLMTVNNQLVNSIHENYKDSLLQTINKEDFAIFQTLEINDEINIDYELVTLEELNGLTRTRDCTVICNRHSGVLIRILDAKIQP